MMQGNHAAFCNHEKVKGHNSFELEPTGHGVCRQHESPSALKMLPQASLFKCEGHVKVKPSTRSCVETQDQSRSEDATLKLGFKGTTQTTKLITMEVAPLKPR